VSNDSIITNTQINAFKEIKYIHCFLCYRFEEQHGFISGARSVFERAVEFFGDESMDEKLYLAFAKFEEGQREVHNEFWNNFSLKALIL
jgi:hypothetical protein